MFEQTMDATLIPQVLWASLFEGGVFSVVSWLHGFSSPIFYSGEQSILVVTSEHHIQRNSNALTVRPWHRMDPLIPPWESVD